MEVIKFKTQDAVSTITDFISKQKFGVAYCMHDMKSVLAAEKNGVDEELCNEMGYEILETRHTGGLVVVNEGDVSVIHFGEIGNDWMRRFALHLIERYKEKGLNATFDGNDILVDGYKISGLSATPYGHIQYSTIHIGINTNLDHIKAICRKPMQKVPKGLSEWGITTEEVEEMFLEFCGQDKEVPG